MDGRSENELSPEECIRAGMYWFGRNDFEAAESWWNKALEVDPGNTRARECLDLLRETTATGFRSTSWAQGRPPTPSPFVNRQAPEANRRPYLDPQDGPPPGGLQAEQTTAVDIDIEATRDDEWEEDLWDDDTVDDAPIVESEETLDDMLASTEVSPVPDPGAPTAWRAQPRVAGTRSFEMSNPTMTTDPLEFASEGSRFKQTSEPSAPTPWDDGPAKTGVVTVETDDFDAVADPTPLPALDRDAYFDRYPRSRQEIVDYLRATGDLPPDLHGSDDVLEPEEATEESPPVEESSDPIQVARNKFQLHDFDGVIDTLESLDTAHPASAEAAQLVAAARTQLLKMYESKIGDFDRTPRQLVSGEEVIWLNLNHRAGFILSQIDGTVTFEDLTALSGMSRLDTVRILAELLAQRVIGV